MHFDVFRCSLCLLTKRGHTWPWLEMIYSMIVCVLGKYCFLIVLLFFRIYLCKQWHQLKTFSGENSLQWFESNCHLFYFFVLYVTDHNGVVTGVRFGKNASFIASVGMDRTLKYYGLQQS